MELVDAQVFLGYGLCLLKGMVSDREFRSLFLSQM